MRKRITSVFLAFTLLLSLLPLLSPTVKAADMDQSNIVARADYLYEVTWECREAVYGWCNNYVFQPGLTYRIPYGQPVDTGACIGFDISVDSFVDATRDSSGAFYSSRSTYGTTNSVYYAMDGAAFVSWCWGVDRKTADTIPLMTTALGKVTIASVMKLQPGDALNSGSAGHTALVTGLTYSGSSVSGIEITEQTPPQLKRTTYTPSALVSKYSTGYTIHRYTGTVPAAPYSPSVDAEKYYPACDSSCATLIEALNSIGVDSSKDHRSRIAAANGITDYSGTYDQNVLMLRLLKSGKLMDPEYQESPPVVYYPACASTCATLVEALASIGVDSSKDHRSRIAAVNGITDYSGTYDQNVKLLELLKSGQLIDPAGASVENTGNGYFANGYLKGYAGGMAGDGKIYAHGLDVSSWQGASLDFAAIKSAGYDYVILRAGTGKGKDSCFETFYTNARNAGLHVGAYYYSYATTVAAARTDADNMLSWINNKTFEYPIYFDYEDVSQDSLSTTTAKNICLTFCNALADAGYLAGVYTGSSRATQLPVEEICARYEIWIARYYDHTYESLTPTYSSEYGMYQYTDSKYIGTKGPYDANVAYKDYPAIVKQYGFNGYADPDEYINKCDIEPTYCQVVTVQSTPINSLPCSIENGSRTLETAQAEQSYVAKALCLNPEGEYWYQITLNTGESAYVSCADTRFVQQLCSDIVLFSVASPGVLREGQNFAVNGAVSSAYNQLDEVQVQICTADGAEVMTATAGISERHCDLSGVALEFGALPAGTYVYRVAAEYSGCYADGQELAEYRVRIVLMEERFSVEACEHSFVYTVIQTETCTQQGLLEASCTKCGTTSRSTVPPVGHDCMTTVQEPTCVSSGIKTDLCTRCDYSTEVAIPAAGHSYSGGSCTRCGIADPNYTPGVTVPTLTLKSPALEFKDMIKVVAFFTAENIDDVVEMGMITYTQKVNVVDVNTAAYVIPGAEYEASSGRYYADSQGIYAKYLADTVYLAIYAKLSDGTYAYSKLAGYSPITYATNQLKNSTNTQLKQLVAAMLNYGAAAQTHFNYNVENLANASLTAEQLALPESYRSDMVSAVPGAAAAKQGSFANNSGFSSRKPAISFEGAFCINYFFTPKYAPANGITLYYWTTEDFNAAEVLTAANATGKFKLEDGGTGEYRGDIAGIAAKAISEAVYVAAAYKDSNGTVWTSGVLGYSIGSYCSSQASKGGTIADLAMATAVYGYHARQFFK